MKISNGFSPAIFLLFSWLDFPSEDEVRRPGPYKLTVVNNVVRVTTIPVMMVGKPIIKLTAENTIKLYNYMATLPDPLLEIQSIFSSWGEIETGYSFRIQ